MRKILLVSYYFPPLNNMAAKRFGTMCKYFEKYGYKAYVLTSYPHENCFLNFKLDLEVPINENRIFRIGKTDINYFPISVFAQIIIQFLERKNMISRTISEISLGWYEKVKSSLNLKMLDDIDIVVGTYPPMGNLMVANYISQNLKCPLVVDIRDLITEYSEDTCGKQRSYRLDNLMEKMILRNATGIVPVTHGFEKILRKKFPNKLLKVIYNGWEEDSCFDEENKIEKYMYYAGSLYSHRLESFELLLKCLKEVIKVKDIKMIIRSVGPDYLDSKVKRMIIESNMDKYIKVLKADKENVIRKEQNGAYINVVLNSIHKEDEALMTTIPGKVFEVIHKNAPVLAISPKNSDIDNIIRFTDKGLSSTSENEIINFILNENEKYKGNNNIDFYSRKHQAKLYCKFLDQIMESNNR